MGFRAIVADMGRNALGVIVVRFKAQFCSIGGPRGSLNVRRFDFGELHGSGAHEERTAYE